MFSISYDRIKMSIEWIFIIGWVVFVAGIIVWGRCKQRRLLESMRAVAPGHEYENNEYIIGVGYFHATACKWYPHAWNEFDEGRGYYWDGTWHEDPDQRMVASGIPDDEEVSRANAAWRKTNAPDIDRNGFGRSTSRTEGR
ncbi:hypothetical protein AYO49_00965 [Verrucomicrobiaceae bacterium SCGC AG-212-N21]|nr:hypothetical protein AYO49_00965 [Verrucomicrobiaceae bacterium SCGC AG-212-N21]